MSSPQPIPPNLMMSAQLEAHQWNVILQALGELPYRVAQPVIDPLRLQLNTQVTQPNGHDRSVVIEGTAGTG